MLRMRDYFGGEGEAAAPGAAAAAGAAAPGAAAGEGEGQGGARPGTVRVSGAPDGVAREWPAALAAAVEAAAASGYAPDFGALREAGAGAGVGEGYDAPPAAAALSALGAALFWLRRCLIDHTVLSMRRVSVYRHADGGASAASTAALLDGGSSSSSSGSGSSGSGDAASRGGRGEGTSPGQLHMALDGNTLLNLDLLENGVDGGRKGTLLGLLDSTTTAPGRRLFRQWMSAPLLAPADINDRLRAVENLMWGWRGGEGSGSGSGEGASSSSSSSSSSSGGGGGPASLAHLKTLRDSLKGLPDLERLLARVHGLGSRTLSRDHPDASAQFYESAAHDKRKIGDFLATIRAFRAGNAIRALFHEERASASAAPAPLPGVTAPMLQRLTHGAFPDLTPLLAFFDRAYDMADKGARAAEKDAKAAKATITPAPGTDAVYDGALAEIASLRGKLDDYLRAQREELRCPALSYFQGAKDTARYQLEVPEATARGLSSRYELLGKTKKCWKYHTPRISELLGRLIEAEAERDGAVKDGLRRLFARFDADRAAWGAAASALAQLDCLTALAQWSALGDGGVMCRPELVLPSSSGGASGGASGSFLHLTGARHPSVARALSSGSGGAMAALHASGGSGGATEFIPNDVLLGSSSGGEGGGEGEGVAAPECVLLTGPNMGGKSTYLRTACVTVILAQMGAYVPAERAVLTPVDRIFTRVGASDRILAGQSTFFVELAETSTILRQATRHSLVILDELGRGTSTFDGNAIAYAVTKHLTTAIGCRTLFATHYHTLCDDFAADPRVALGHMGCLVEEDEGAAMASPAAAAAAASASPAAAAALASAGARVTFLYKYTAGACPKSYGLNVARLARLPESIILRAAEKSAEFEKAVEEAERGVRQRSSGAAGRGGGGEEEEA